MNKFIAKAIPFWFVLLLLALLNATIRETTYKPLLLPYIGFWAHQLSSLTGITLFFIAIYQFLKSSKSTYQKKDLALIGVMWISLTLIFETGMNMYVRQLSMNQVLETYYFWRGDTWVFVLLSLAVSPFLADMLLHRKINK